MKQLFDKVSERCSKIVTESYKKLITLDFFYKVNGLLNNYFTQFFQLKNYTSTYLFQVEFLVLLKN